MFLQVLVTSYVFGSIKLPIGAGKSLELLGSDHFSIEYQTETGEEVGVEDSKSENVGSQVGLVISVFDYK